MGEEMDENLAIPKHTLDQIRSLSDADLAKLIAEISDYGWAKSEPTLRMMIGDKENRR
jgi:hypothetical protein